MTATIPQTMTMTATAMKTCKSNAKCTVKLIHRINFTKMVVMVYGRHCRTPSALDVGWVEYELESDVIYRRSAIATSVSLTVWSVAITHYHIRTARRSDSIFHVTTCSTTVSATERATVLSACMMAGTVRRNSIHAIQTTTRTASNTMRTGSATRAVMYRSVCGTGWTVSPTGTLLPGVSCSSLLYRRLSLPTFGRRSYVSSVASCAPWWRLLVTTTATKWLNLWTSALDAEDRWLDKLSTLSSVINVLPLLGL